MTGRNKVAAPAARRPRKTNGQRSVAGTQGKVPASAPPDQPMPGTGATNQLVDEIDFQGRTMRVKMPDVEQVVVYRRMLKRLESIDTNKITGQQVVDMVDRTLLIVDAVLVDQHDREWVDDQMMSKQIGIKDAATIVLEATRTMANRQQRRATAKASPARRTKAA